MNGRTLDAVALALALSIPATLLAVPNPTTKAALTLAALLVVFVLGKLSPQPGRIRSDAPPPPPPDEKP